MSNDSKLAYRSTMPAWLILEDGTVFKGLSLGVPGTTIGEVVFTTGMTGYQETLTDPSYYGQIVTQTFPLIGNYGLNSVDYESRDVWLSGYIIREWCYEPSNFRSKTDLGHYLEAHNVVGIYDIDTRHLTKKLREAGVMNGVITTELPAELGSVRLLGQITEDGKLGDTVFTGSESEKKQCEDALKILMQRIRDFKIKDAVPTVSYSKIISYTVDDPIARVVLLDFGFKRNILRNLNQRGCEVYVVPYNTTAEQILALKPDGIMLSNGPGDPEDNPEVIATLKELLKTDLPILGICLGHQLMAIANGGKTTKLKYGHRGANQPVKELAKDRVYVTTQNHGYAVVSESITPDIGTVSHVNVNDGSCEGVLYNRPNTMTVQFHPEAAAGPRDTQNLFNVFVSNMTGLTAEEIWKDRYVENLHYQEAIGESSKKGGDK